MLARSCGFEVKESIKVSKSGYGKGKEQYRLNIKGNINIIPVKIKRKISTIERFNTTNSSGIEIKKLSKVHKILCICNHEHINDLETKLKIMFKECQIVKSSNILIEITHQNISKAFAIKKFLISFLL